MDEISPNCTRPVDIVGIFPIFCKISEEGGAGVQKSSFAILP